MAKKQKTILQAQKPRRAGGGRKTIYNDVLVKITIRIPQYQIDFINSVPEEKGQSAALRKIIDESIASNTFQKHKGDNVP